MNKIMKNTALSLLLASSLYAAEPATINFQGYLTNTSDIAINETKSITFRIYDVSTGGTYLWTSTKSLLISNGVYSTALGSDVAFNLSAMKFDKQYYLGINIDGDGEMTPRTAMTNNAYANVFKPVATADLNATYLDVASDSDNNPVTLAEVKALVLNWTLNGGLTEAPPTLITGLTHNTLTYNEVYHDGTQRIWLDRNIGAFEICTVSGDASTPGCKGDYFQWGRAADGHEKSSSGTTTTKAATLTVGHGNFINSGGSGAWTTTSLTTWDGTNRDVCPTGYSIPTRSEWTTLYANGSYADLKLPDAGFRENSSGNISSGSYTWASDLDSSGNGQIIQLGGSNVYAQDGFKTHGISVRCIKDQ